MPAVLKTGSKKIEFPGGQGLAVDPVRMSPQWKPLDPGDACAPNRITCTVGDEDIETLFMWQRRFGTQNRSETMRSILRTARAYLEKERAAKRVRKGLQPARRTPGDG